MVTIGVLVGYASLGIDYPQHGQQIPRRRKFDSYLVALDTVVGRLEQMYVLIPSFDRIAQVRERHWACRYEWPFVKHMEIRSYRMV